MKNAIMSIILFFCAVVFISLSYIGIDYLRRSNCKRIALEMMRYGNRNNIESHIKNLKYVKKLNTSIYGEDSLEKKCEIVTYNIGNEEISVYYVDNGKLNRCICYGWPD